MDSLPAITGSPSPASGLSNVTSATSPPTGSFNNQNVASNSSYSFLNSQPTGATGGFGGASAARSTLGVGLRPQITGGGAANPFRASMAAGLAMPGGTSTQNFGASPFPFQTSPTGLPSNAGQPFGANSFGGVLGNQQQPQQSATNSLI